MEKFFHTNHVSKLLTINFYYHEKTVLNIAAVLVAAQFFSACSQENVPFETEKKKFILAKFSIPPKVVLE